MGKFKDLTIEDADLAEMDDTNEGVDTGTLEGYVHGLGRDIPAPRRSHLYKGDFSDPGLPMCRYGWNRKEDGYSIWRGNVGEDGVCKICWKRAMKGLDGVDNPWYSEEDRIRDEQEWKELMGSASEQNKEGR